MNCSPFLWRRAAGTGFAFLCGLVTSCVSNRDFGRTNAMVKQARGNVPKKKSIFTMKRLIEKKFGTLPKIS
jgi:hypothetical protein